MSATPTEPDRTGGRDPNRGIPPDDDPGQMVAPASPTESMSSMAPSATPPGGRRTAAGDDLLPMRLTLAPGIVVPGQVAAFVGSFGPAPGAGRARVLISGTLNHGVSYRSVESTQGGRCAMTTLQFDCDLELAAARPATVSIRLLADGLAAPPYVRQQLSVQIVPIPAGATKTAGATTRNTMTRTTPTGPPAVTGLAAAISGGPGPVVVLLALYLLALAAAEHERRRPGRRSRPNRPERGPR